MIFLACFFIGMGLIVIGWGVAEMRTAGPGSRKNLTAEELQEKSLIGYKRAVLMLDEKAFTGVTDMASPYSCDEVAAEGSPGFHSYYSIADALKHPQPGTVYLEVLAHGDVLHHDLGVTSGAQRVLQVLLGDCTDCGERQAEYWIQRPARKNVGVAERFLFVCIECSSLYARPRRPEELESELAAYCPPGHSVTVGTLKPSSWGREFRPSQMERGEAA